MTRERPARWGVESTRYHIPNMVSCEISTKRTWTPLICAYLHASTLEHLSDLEEALKLFRDPIVLRGLKSDLDKVRSPRIQRVGISSRSTGS